MSTEHEVRQMKRRRGTMLKFIRQNHEDQRARMDDFDVYSMMQDLGYHMGRKEVITMLQDLGTLGLISFSEKFDEEQERMRLVQIQLTSVGLGLALRRKSNEEVSFD